MFDLRLPRAVLTISLLAAPALAQHDAAPPAPSTPPGAADSAIEALGESPIAALLDKLGPDVRAYDQHISTLANPFFEGRVPGSTGNRLAAEYIEFYFRQAGLQPAFPTETKAADGTIVATPNSSYRQPFSAGTDLKVADEYVSLELEPGAAPLVLAPRTDFNVLGLSGDGTVQAPIAFAGYSINAGEDEYSSYPEGTDLKGKIALILRFEPMDADGKSLWTGGQGWSMHAGMEPKIAAAAEHGAAAIILVNPPGADDPRASTLVDAASSRPGGPGQPVPVAMLSTEQADKLVRAADIQGRSLMELRALADQAGGVIDLPKATATITARVARDEILTDNVGGVLPGKGDLAHEFIIIGAHYDHVGFGPIGADPSNFGKLHPGADDNASGTVGLLMAAQKLTDQYAALPADASVRSVLFLAFSAEESGLIGSRYYVNHPTISLSQMYLMINMDMIGRLRAETELEIGGVDSAKGLEDVLKPTFEASGLPIKHGPRVATNSDHWSFYRAEVPALFFFTGLHREYHKPQDYSWTVNSVGAVRVLTLAVDVARQLAGRHEPLEFFDINKKLDDEQPPDPHAQGNVQPGRMRVRFGIAPGNYADAKPGIDVADVYEGTTAEEAGLQIGDRILKWNGKDIRSVEDWMPMLFEANPGDEVEIVYTRGGEEHTTKAKLKARDPGGR